MSVDTYLQRKNTSKYQKAEHQGVQVMVSPTLVQQAKSVSVDLKRFLIWAHYDVEVEPLHGHFHGPACRH